MHLIILCGLRKCGKTTLGLKLAERLDYQFFDLDRLVLETSSMVYKSPGKLRRKFGIEVYNRLEEDAMRNFREWIMPLPQYAGKILSLGSRTVTNLKALRWLGNHGLRVYLRASAQLLFHRNKYDESKWKKFCTQYSKDDIRCASFSDYIYTVSDSPIIVNSQRLFLQIEQLAKQRHFL